MHPFSVPMHLESQADKATHMKRAQELADASSKYGSFELTFQEDAATSFHSSTCCTERGTRSDENRTQQGTVLRNMDAELDRLFPNSENSCSSFHHDHIAMQIELQDKMEGHIITSSNKSLPFGSMLSSANGLSDPNRFNSIVCSEALVQEGRASIGCVHKPQHGDSIFKKRFKRSSTFKLPNFLISFFVRHTR